MCPWFKSWLAICCGAFLATKPLIKLLVQPDRSIVIVIGEGGGWGVGPPPHYIHPWAVHPHLLGAALLHLTLQGLHLQGWPDGPHAEAVWASFRPPLWHRHTLSILPACGQAPPAPSCTTLCTHLIHAQLWHTQHPDPSPSIAQARIPFVPLCSTGLCMGGIWLHSDKALRTQWLRSAPTHSYSHRKTMP